MNFLEKEKVGVRFFHCSYQFQQILGIFVIINVRQSLSEAAVIPLPDFEQLCSCQRSLCFAKRPVRRKGQSTDGLIEDDAICPNIIRDIASNGYNRCSNILVSE